MDLIACADTRDMIPRLRCRMLVAERIRSQRYPIDWNRYGMDTLGLGELEAVVLYILVLAKPIVSEKRDASREFRTRWVIWRQILPNSGASARQQSTL